MSPFCVVEPLEDQEKQEKVWVVFNDVDGLRFDDVLSIDPGNVNGSACQKASVLDIGLETDPRTNQEDINRVGDVERRRCYVGRIYCTLDIRGLPRPWTWCFADQL